MILTVGCNRDDIWDDFMELHGVSWNIWNLRKILWEQPWDFVRHGLSPPLKNHPQSESYYVLLLCLQPISVRPTYPPFALVKLSPTDFPTQSSRPRRVTNIPGASDLATWWRPAESSDALWHWTLRWWNASWNASKGSALCPEASGSWTRFWNPTSFPC